MFKLMVVGGPTKGTSVALKDGETSIGRVAGNDIVLQSQKVSKKHCVLVVNNKEVMVKDAGSSNGTFVNGVLTKLRKIAVGDRVSVGEYVLELRAGEVARAPAPMQNMGNVIPFTGGGVPVAGMGGGRTNTNLNMMAAAAAVNAGVPNAAAPPQSLPEKVKFYFEKYVINFVYNLNEKHEWRVMMAGMFAVLTVAAAILAVYPVLDRVGEKLGNEARGRALLLARQIVDRNAQAVFEHMESRADVSFIEKEPAVVAAYLVDMEGRVMAPGRKLNQYLSDATEAAFSAKVRNIFLDKESVERWTEVHGDLVAAAVPLKILNQATGKNVPVALGLVFFDRGIVMIDSGTEALIYVQAVILIGIVAVIIFFSLYRLTMRPLTNLNDEIDQVLKGNAGGVSKKFKMEELDPLIDVVNAALQRMTTGLGGGPSTGDAGVDDVLNTLKFVANRMSGAGMIVFTGDRKIAHVSPFMEEIAGFRNDSSIGSDISAVARDAAFIAFVEDLLGKAQPAGSEPVADDFEFSGTSYRMECVAYGPPGAPKAFALTAVKPA